MFSKKMHILTILSLIALFGCTSLPTEPIDHGTYNPDGVAAEELVRLNIGNYISVLKIDDQNVEWDSSDNKFAPHFVTVPQGNHVFSVSYRSREVFTLMPSKLISHLEAGEEYLIDGQISGNKIQFSIINVKDGSEANINFDKLSGNAPGTIPQYIKYILNPTMDENNKTVTLENDQYTLLIKPDMIYELMIKKTGEIRRGRRGFTTDMTMQSGKTYLLEVDPEEMTREEFLEIKDTMEISDFVLEPIECNESQVTYKYIKPVELKDQLITFKIIN